ncbi:hypothetical protein M422DRAFT_45636 [Sphaerobolus stellatus SS14]|nr:hypothetical protein M422DRAFT_45636 [Sphaerobolus stellatus SS14]
MPALVTLEDNEENEPAADPPLITETDTSEGGMSVMKSLIPPRSKSPFSKIKTLFSDLKSRAKGELLVLKTLMAQPPRCAFLGSQATAADAWIGDYGKQQFRVVMDSGADITLISQETLSQLESRQKIKTGQRINLVQVTGGSTISGFVTTPIYFDTSEGPVKLEVEAYVVKGIRNDHSIHLRQQFFGSIRSLSDSHRPRSPLTIW